MRNMSFSMTTKQVRDKTKFITRRFGWWHLKPGDIIQPVEKCMGLKAGEAMVKIGEPIMIVRAYSEPLNAITKEDVILEGFPDWSPQQFVDMLVKKYRCSPDKIVNRIEFKYL